MTAAHPRLLVSASQQRRKTREPSIHERSRSFRLVSAGLLGSAPAGPSTELPQGARDQPRANFNSSSRTRSMWSCLSTVALAGRSVSHGLFPPREHGHVSDTEPGVLTLVSLSPTLPGSSLHSQAFLLPLCAHARAHRQSDHGSFVWVSARACPVSGGGSTDSIVLLCRSSQTDKLFFLLLEHLCPARQTLVRPGGSLKVPHSTHPASSSRSVLARISLSVGRNTPTDRSRRPSLPPCAPLKRRLRQRPLDPRDVRLLPSVSRCG